MSDGVFPVAKGRVIQLSLSVLDGDPSTSGFVIVLLKDAEDEAVLEGYETLSALLNSPDSTEADFSSYERKVLAASDFNNPVINSNLYTLDFPDLSWSPAGGAVNNSLHKVLLCYAEDTSSNDGGVIPLAHYDFPVITTGTTLTLRWSSSGVYAAE